MVASEAHLTLFLGGKRTVDSVEGMAFKELPVVSPQAQRVANAPSPLRLGDPRRRGGRVSSLSSSDGGDESEASNTSYRITPSQRGLGDGTLVATQFLKQMTTPLTKRVAFILGRVKSRRGLCV